MNPFGKPKKRGFQLCRRATHLRVQLDSPPDHSGENLEVVSAASVGSELLVS